jgi:hypothetical protein
MTAHDEMRRAMIARARLTDEELATAAARFGIVADRDALPLNACSVSMAAIEAGRIAGDPRSPGNDLGRFARLAEAIARQRSTGDVWAGVVAARADKTTHTERLYESSDAFEEMYRGGPVNVGRTVVGATLVRAPIYSAGIASLARVVA